MKEHKQKTEDKLYQPTSGHFGGVSGKNRLVPCFTNR